MSSWLPQAKEYAKQFIYTLSSDNTQKNQPVSIYHFAAKLGKDVNEIPVERQHLLDAIESISLNKGETRLFNVLLEIVNEPAQAHSVILLITDGNDETNVASTTQMPNRPIQNKHEPNLQDVIEKARQNHWIIFVIGVGGDNLNRKVVKSLADEPYGGCILDPTSSVADSFFLSIIDALRNGLGYLTTDCQMN